ncbi:MAG: rhodanese-like domain-containing protein [Planctomycetota bacterium]|jgi:rhodanese-related sulfurtransferase
MKTLPGLLLEASLVVAAGLALGWAGNELSPRGLRVDRDYFPRAPTTAVMNAVAPEGPRSDPAGDPAGDAAAPAPPATDTTGDPAAPATDVAGDPGQQKAVERLQARGLVPFHFDEARATFEDDMYAAGAYLFLDARSEEEHALGHIPGAYVFDHYHIERYLNEIMALAPSSMRMVVYCSGGDCEDSEFAAATLAELLPDPGVLRVYVGGMTEWEQRDMPIETGPRGSGVITGGGR